MNKTRLEGVKDKKTGLPVIDPESGDVQKREVSNRRAGYDFTFSAPKSVSLYLTVNEDKVVEQMITEAVDETMAAIESWMETKVRKGYQQENRLSRNMVYARTRFVGHFEDAQLPPPGNLQMDGYSGDGARLISQKMMVDRNFGSAHMTMFVVEFAKGGGGSHHTQVKYRKQAYHLAALFYFVLYSLLHTHDVAARQG